VVEVSKLPGPVLSLQHKVYEAPSSVFPLTPPVVAMLAMFQVESRCK